MALIKCSECGKEFSDKAKACPNCACPVEDVKKFIDEEKIKEEKHIEEVKPVDQTLNNSSSSDKKVFMWIAIACVSLIALMGVIFLFRGDDKQTQSNERDFSVLQVRVIVDSINIRSENNVESNILGTVYKDEIYTVLSIDYKSPYHFYEIETRDGTRGFIAGVSQGVEYVEELIPGDFIRPDEEPTNNEVTENKNTTTTSKPKSQTNTTKTNTNKNTQTNNVINTNTNTNTNSTQKPSTNTNTSTNMNTNSNTSTNTTNNVTNNTNNYHIVSISGIGGKYPYGSPNGYFNECRLDDFKASIEKLTTGKIRITYTATITQLVNYKSYDTQCIISYTVYDSNNINVYSSNIRAKVKEGETARINGTSTFDESGTNYKISFSKYM